jgi:hypothetical protein
MVETEEPAHEKGEEEKRESGLDKFASAALRAPKKGAQAQFIAQELIMSTNAAPFKCIVHICKAVMLAEGSEYIEGVDSALLRHIYQVNQALMSPCQRKIDQYGTVMVSVNWGFKNTEQNYNDFINPWYVDFQYFSNYIKLHRVVGYEIKHKSVIPSCHFSFGAFLEAEADKMLSEILGKQCPGCGWLIRDENEIDVKEAMVVSQKPFSSFFFEATNYLTERGHGLLCNAFINYAMPITQQAKARLSKNITPAIYEETLKILMGQKPEENEEENQEDE